MSWRETRNNSQDATWLTCVIKCDFLGTSTSENRQIEIDVALLARIPYFGEKYLFKSLLISSDLTKLKDSSIFMRITVSNVPPEGASTLCNIVLYFTLTLVSQTIKCGRVGLLIVIHLEVSKGRSPFPIQLFA